ncbi:unnamed protein product [[Candida] boidinii]|uniref:Unnamed protein product n=1 Tax=Candida boidinii TaxID=5477 RepID=A0A9W6WJ46_CANBO|nr:unnamed protein product [[Candida] boidinii]
MILADRNKPTFGFVPLPLAVKALFPVTVSPIDSSFSDLTFFLLPVDVDPPPGVADLERSALPVPEELTTEDPVLVDPATVSKPVLPGVPLAGPEAPGVADAPALPPLLFGLLILIVKPEPVPLGRALCEPE